MLIGYFFVNLISLHDRAFFTGMLQRAWLSWATRSRDLSKPHPRVGVVNKSRLCISFLVGS